MVYVKRTNFYLTLGTPSVRDLRLPLSHKKAPLCSGPTNGFAPVRRYRWWDNGETNDDDSNQTVRGMKKPRAAAAAGGVVVHG